MAKPCWRVPIQLRRKSVDGQYWIIEREGPVVTAATREEARERARHACGGWPDFLDMGEPVLLHTSHAALSAPVIVELVVARG